MTTHQDVALDPQIWARNLEALSLQQPPICTLLSSTELPQSVVLVDGRDGSPTFRLGGSDGGSTWLGHSSMPTVSSPAVLAEFAFGSVNVLLPSIGHGFEAKRLLRMMAVHQAVFTWDADPLIPALALRLHDFSAEIRRGRLLLAVGPSAGQALLDCLEHYPAHLPPMKIFSAPHLQPSEVHQIQVQAETVAATQSNRLLRDTAELTAQLTSGTARHASGRRLLILSLIIDAEVSRVADALERAARQAGAECLAHTVDRPGHIHIVSGAGQLAEFQPTDVILLNQVKGEWGDLLRNVPRCATWCVSPSANRAPLFEKVSRQDVLWAVDGECSAKIRAAERSTPEVRSLLPAADGSLFHAAELDAEALEEYGSDVAIVLSAVDFSPQAIGLKWDSHRDLLDEIVALISKDPRRLSIEAADQLIDLAGRRTRVRLDSGEVRRDLARFISAGIAPTLAARKLLELLSRGNVTCKLWGANWEMYPETADVRCGPPPSHDQRNKIYNAAKLIVHLRNDDWHRQHLLDAVAAGACVLRHAESHSDASADPAWHELSSAIPSFAGVPQAYHTIRNWLVEERRRSEPMAQAHRLVQECHLMSHRLQTLLDDR